MFFYTLSVEFLIYADGPLLKEWLTKLNVAIWLQTLISGGTEQIFEEELLLFIAYQILRGAWSGSMVKKWSFVV